MIKSSLKLLLENLGEQDRVSIVTYAGTTGVLLKSTSVTDENRDSIIEHIDSLRSSYGGTNGVGGIELAYQQAEDGFISDGNNRIILLTDGDFNVGMSDSDELEELISEKRDSGVFLTVVGMGYGNYRDDIGERLADNGNGNYFYADSLLEVKKIFVEKINGTLYTIGKDVKIQVEFNPKFVGKYRLIGYENRLLNSEDFVDDSKDGGEIGAGHTVTALYEIVPTSEALNGELKYQEVQLSEAGMSDEVATIKVRYKEPDEDESLEVSETVSYDFNLTADLNSEDFHFASAVASFGMVLRNSPYAGETSFSRILDVAKESKGDDLNGYRAEFIKLVESVELIEKDSDSSFNSVY